MSKKKMVSSACYGAAKKAFSLMVHVTGPLLLVGGFADLIEGKKYKYREDQLNTAKKFRGCMAVMAGSLMTAGTINSINKQIINKQTKNEKATRNVTPEKKEEEIIY